MPGRVTAPFRRLAALHLRNPEHAPHLLDAEIVLFDDIEAEARQRAGHKRRIVCRVRRTGVTSNRLARSTMSLMISSRFCLIDFDGRVGHRLKLPLVLFGLSITCTAQFELVELVN